MNTFRNILIFTVLGLSLVSGALVYMTAVGNDYSKTMENTPLNNSTLLSNINDLTVDMRGEVKEAQPDTSGGIEFSLSIGTGVYNAIRIFFDFGSTLTSLANFMFQTPSFTIPSWFALAVFSMIDIFILATIVYMILFRDD